MSFQWLFDTMSGCIVDRLPAVATTLTASGQQNTATRNNTTTRFVITPPAGLPYDTYREDINNSEYTQFTGGQGFKNSSLVKIRQANQLWMFPTPTLVEDNGGYLPGGANSTTDKFQLLVISGNLRLRAPVDGSNVSHAHDSGGNTTTGDKILVKGQTLSLEDGDDRYTFVVTEDVNRVVQSSDGNRTITNNIPVDRAVSSDLTSGTLYDAEVYPTKVEYRVRCITQPNKFLFDRNLIGWDGDFVFMEVTDV